METVRPVKVSFSDLTHTGQIVATNTFPLGISMVAAYAKQELGDEIEIDVFRYPDDFGRYLEKSVPDIACFSVFLWNQAIAHEYAKRIKSQSPDTVTIFGGVNFPDSEAEQLEYLERYPAIDFFIEGEGELAFVELLQRLGETGYDGKAFKEGRYSSPNLRYIVNHELVSEPKMARIVDLNVVPSTFANGLSDKFFDKILTPMIETSRGCPYSCTFCHEGGSYYSKTRRVSQDKINGELTYISERSPVPELIITDLNFGIFKEDLDTARHLASLQEKHDWPKFVVLATAKNNKERVIEASKMMGGALYAGAAVQTTDSNVLDQIKRKNLSLEQMTEVGRTTATDNANSFSEIILCLPGDSKAAHFQTVTDMIETGINLLRSHQFMLLNGTEAASRVSREIYQMDTRWRVTPAQYGIYKLFDEEFQLAEIEEICVANNTMSYQDYQDCRSLDLTVEIFNNGGVFSVLLQFITRHGVSRADFILQVYNFINSSDGTIAQVYDRFNQQEKSNLWSDRAELEDYLQEPGIIDKFISGEFGGNELYRGRAEALFNHMEDLHRISYLVARDLLKSANRDPLLSVYLDELEQFSVLRKRDFLSNVEPERGRFQFDFGSLIESNFQIDPTEAYRPDGVELEIFHSDRQRKLIDGYVDQYGTSMVGLTRILSRAHVKSMYRDVRTV